MLLLGKPQILGRRPRTQAILPANPPTGGATAARISYRASPRGHARGHLPVTTCPVGTCPVATCPWPRPCACELPCHRRCFCLAWAIPAPWCVPPFRRSQAAINCGPKTSLPSRHCSAAARAARFRRSRGPGEESPSPGLPSPPRPAPATALGVPGPGCTAPTASTT